MVPLTPTGLLSRMKALALLDALLSPEWQFRYFSFDSAWDTHEEMGSVRDGSGNHLFVHFGPAGVFLVGFDHEHASDPRVFDGLPDEFHACRDEPAFDTEYANLCVWCPTGGDWNHASVPQQTGLLRLALGGPDAYVAFAEDYFERPVPRDVVERCFASEPLDEQMVRAVNPELSLADVAEDLLEIGYATLEGV